jgi:hypothetical protein
MVVKKITFFVIVSAVIQIFFLYRWLVQFHSNFGLI